jgi:methionine-rich copper-binding protein CopC
MALLFVGSAASTSTANAAAAGNNTLSSSNPAASETVNVAPTQLQLVFTNPLADPNDVNQMGLSLVCNGNIVSLGTPQLSSDMKTVSVPLTQVPQAGSCVVSWALPDGSSGAYSFTSAITPPTTTTTTIPGQATVPSTIAPSGEITPVADNSPRVGGPLGLFRMLSYLFVGTLFGGFLLILFAWPEGVEYPVCKRFMRLVWLATSVQRFYDSVLIVGIMSIFFWHTFINMAMVSGLLPIVGIPLPLMSYGGSSMLTFGVGVGIATSISNSKNFFN